MAAAKSMTPNETSADGRDAAQAAEQVGHAEGLAALPRVVAANLRSVSWGHLLSLRALGFALARAWVYLTFIGAAASAITWNGQSVPGVVFNVSTAALFLTMFCSAFASARFNGFIHRPGVRWLGPVLTCLGTLCVASTTLPGAPQTLLCAVGGLTTGVGSGLIDMGYGELYRNVPSNQTCIEAPFAFLVAAVVYFATSALPPVAACVATTLLPAVSGIILFGHLKVWAPATRPATQPVPISVTRFAARIGACAALVGLADGVVRAVFMAASGTSLQEFYQAPLLWASAITVAVIWGCVLLSPSFSLRGVYKITVIIMAFCFQLLPIVVGSQLQSVLALAGYGTFNVLIWILLADVAYTYRLSSVTVFGVGWSMITIGVFFGSLVGRTVCDAFAPFTPQALSIVALAATLAILLSYMFILKESDLVKLTQLGELHEASRATAAMRDGTAADQKAAGEKASRGAGASGNESESGVLGGSGRTGRTGTDGTPRFVNRCKQVAAAHGLTERETEIMILYAKGRSYARLQEELNLSRGTITTHLRHVYQKLDVHDKQEFLDLIEGRRPDCAPVE